MPKKIIYRNILVKALKSKYFSQDNSINQFQSKNSSQGMKIYQNTLIKAL